jgi:putative heme transporter
MADAYPADATVPTAAAAPRPPTTDRRSILIRILVLVAVMAFVLLGVLPRLVDYSAVQATIATLTTVELVAIVAATLLAYLANAWPSRVLVPGLSWRRALASDISARAVVSTIPGPTDIATRFVLYRQWAIPTDVASAGIALAAFTEVVSTFALPLIATMGLVVSGNAIRPSVIWLTLIGIVVFAIAAILLVAISRSEGAARRLGEGLDWLAKHIWPLVRKKPPTGIVDNTLAIRDRSSGILSRSGVAGFGAAIGAKLAWFLVFEVCLWAVGVPWDVLSPVAVLAAMAVVGVVSFVPITPGAVGVSEVAYVGILSSVTGQAAAGEITAAVLLFRVAQWLAPIPIGWLVLAYLRRDHLKDLFRAATTDDARA